MTTRRPYTILVSCAGRRVGLLRTFRDAVESLGMTGRIIASDLSWTAPAMHLADQGYVAPRCTDPLFALYMTDLCTRERVDLVIPTIDTELPVWSQLREDLARAAGTVVAVSTPATVDIAADKRRTNDHCRANGVDCPRQTTVSGVLDDRVQWELPLIVKPVRGSASQGLRRIVAWSELATLADQGDLVVEEVAPGVEYTVDVFVDRAGVVHCPVVRRRLEIRAGEVSKAQVVRNGLIESLAVKAVETLPGAYGVLNVQVFSDGQNAMVIEINARFAGGYPLTWNAGGRFGEWLIREAVHGQPPPADPVIVDGLTMLRWDEEVYLHRDAS